MQLMWFLYDFNLKSQIKVNLMKELVIEEKCGFDINMDLNTSVLDTGLILYMPTY